MLFAKFILDFLHISVKQHALERKATFVKSVICEQFEDFLFHFPDVTGLT